MIKRHQACRIVPMESYPDGILKPTEETFGMIGIVNKANIVDGYTWYDVKLFEESGETISFLAGELEEVTEMERDIALASHFGLENWL